MLAWAVLGHPYIQGGGFRVSGANAGTPGTLPGNEAGAVMLRLVVMAVQSFGEVRVSWGPQAFGPEHLPLEELSKLPI